MKPRELALAALGVALFAVGWTLSRSDRSNPAAESIVLDTSDCHLPADVLRNDSMPQQSPVFVIFHGLAANRQIMMPVARGLAGGARRVYVVDLPGHGENTQPFSFERVEACAAEGVTAVLKREGASEDQLVLVGHSMGGAVVICLAKQFPHTAATFAFSPAPAELPAWAPRSFLPFPPPERLPGNLLIVMGSLDIPFSGRATEALLQRNGGQRDSPADFQRRRAQEMFVVPHSTHTSILFARETWKEMDRWLHATFGVESNLPLVRRPRSWPFWMGVIGLGLVCPLCISGLARALTVSLRQRELMPPEKWKWLRWLVAAFVATLVLAAAPLRLPRMYSGDYVASFLLITGGLLFLPLGRKTGAFQGFRMEAGEWRRMLLGAIFAFAVMLAFGAWLRANIFDAWLNAARWAHFVPLLVLLFPYAVAEERALGPPEGSAKARAWRFGVYLGRRILLWIVLVLSIFVFRSRQILLLLLVVYMTLYSLGQRLCVDAVWRRTRSPLAAAVSNAILGAWFVALFPLT